MAARSDRGAMRPGRSRSSSGRAGPWCQSAFKIGSDAILMTGNLARIDFVESIQGNGSATEQSYRALRCVDPGTGASAEIESRFNGIG